MPATDLPNSDPETVDTTATETSVAFPVLPIPDGVIFPEMVVTVTLQSPEALKVLDTVMAEQQSNPDAGPAVVLLVSKTDNKFAKVGVTATVEGRDTLPDGTPVVTLRAHHRAVVGSGVIGRTGGLWVQAEVIRDPHLTTADGSEAIEATRALAVEYRAVAKALLERVGGGRAIGAIPKVDKPGPLADSIAYWPELSHEQKLKLLETVQIDERLRLATTWAKAALAEIDVRRDIEGKVNEGLEENQREAILRRQLAAIQSELGEGDGDGIADYRAKLAALTVEGAELLPEATAEHIEREINRLERIGNESMESNWIRTWLDTVFDIPWANSASERIELTAARTILDEDHTGLDEVKERLIEYLAVRQLKASRAAMRTDDEQPAGDGETTPSPQRGRRRGGAILALVGPPGVGKTSLGESVARSLGRSFVRLALGGVRDEAEIRGHRRTYVGARAGRLVNALVEAGSMNPVVLLDEIDKVSGGWNGDPSAALLEVLDPAQNHSFRDHYLEFELDLSDVVFIATANTLDTIPAPLLDRLEVISVDGYTTAEKVTIGRDHLLPRLIERNGLEPGELVIDDEALTSVAADYTREAGVRQLERQLDKIVRKAAVRISDAEGSEETPTVTVTVDDLSDLLGKPIPREETADRIDRPGIATGLAVTGAGGDVLFVETALVEGSGDPILTGQLGDVMKESASIVRSLVAIQLEAEGKSMPTDRRIHVHFPAGAVPKDGPSAGITMTTALVSLLTGRQVRADVAMTGEITLQGKVLPIGGVKQKVLAAHRAGIKTVLLPIGNGRDLDDIPDDVRDLIDIKLVATIDDVLTEALEPAA
ncbi:MAG: endopeptidase La [Acidimicrobiia bacterium]|nr:endopeptidase La [Acidimicrobiia bacterium]